MATAKKKTSAPKAKTEAASEPTPQIPTTITPPAPAEAAIWPLIPSRLEIASKCAPLEVKVKEVETKASEFATVDSEPRAEEALALVDFIKKSEQAIDRRRRQYVDPPNEFVKTLNGIVKDYSGRLEATRKILSGKILAYQNTKAEKLRAEAEEKRRQEEAEAKKRADALVAQGKQEEANKLMTIAQTAPEAKIDTKIRAADGPSSVVTTVFQGQIVSMKDFLQAVVEGKLDNYIFPAQHISVQAIPLNKFAKDNASSEGQVIHGIKIVKDQRLGTK